MRTKTNQIWLARLNSEAIFVQFTDTTWHNEPTDSAKASYFGREIYVSFPNATKPDPEDPESFVSFTVEIYSDDKNSNTHYLMDQKGSVDFENFEEMLQAINNYICSRPFTILKHSKEKYRLLDPAGFDYVGEYITLADAKKTCGYNFIMED